ncbi:MAG: indole-3-glycerol phosphate synthase [Bryobacterales bacterium]|nr:indole-3-glycerol phosphate synthase [Bryobacterales bacterium]
MRPKPLKTNTSTNRKLGSPPRREPNANPISATPLRYHRCLPPAAPDILARIVSRKHEELREATTPLAHLRHLAETRTDQRNFAASLRSKHPAIISEIKKASPSKGVLVEDFHPADLAMKYQQGGAVALSVLTDKDFFQGSLADLRAARAACMLPVIRKDFTISDYHVYEAAAAGADAILLIVAVLDEAELRAYRQLAQTCGMAALVEAHNADEVDTAVRSGAEIIGINNRDLRTFKVSLDTSINLAPSIPPGITKVSESGIFLAADIRRLTDAGFDAFLVGEHLVKSGDATRALQELVA